MLFELGRIVATSSVAAFFEDDEARQGFMGLCLRRHTVCDWGDLDREDVRANAKALKSGDRLLSSYIIPPSLVEGVYDTKLWIITESDRSCTTILFPSDY
jgi:hypothetical protein